MRKKSIIGRDWLARLNFKVAESSNNSEFNNNIISNNDIKTNKTEKSPELQRMENNFPKILKRQGKIVGKNLIRRKSEGNTTEAKKSAPATTKSSGWRNQKSSGSRSYWAYWQNNRWDVYPTTGDNSQEGPKRQARTWYQVAQQCHIEREESDAESRESDRNHSRIINGKQEGEVWFTSLDMVYAYGQTVLHPETAKHCIFQITGGETTSTFAFKQVTMAQQHCHLTSRK